MNERDYYVIQTKQSLIPGLPGLPQIASLGTLKSKSVVQ